MSDPRDAPLRRGVLLCRSHMALAVLRGDYPSMAPPSLAEAIGDLHGDLRHAFLVGYAEELKRHEGGAEDARYQTQESWLVYSEGLKHHPVNPAA